MTRQHLTFPCGGDVLAGTLDMGTMSGPAGVLIVSGGREIRSGSWGGQAQMAARLAAAGVPVFRYDRRGIGQSSGADPGFESSGEDIAAALAAFRAAVPGMREVIGFGNCDAASALMLHGAGLGFHGLVLANPWTIAADAAGVPPPAALRQRYLAKLANPREILRLLTGGVDLGKLVRGLRQASSAPPESALAAAMAAGLAEWGGPAMILLAAGDRTAQLFEAAWPANDPRVKRHDSAGHSFPGEAAQAWLFDRLIAAAQRREMPVMPARFS